MKSVLRGCVSGVTRVLGMKNIIRDGMPLTGAGPRRSPMRACSMANQPGHSPPGTVAWAAITLGTRASFVSSVVRSVSLRASMQDSAQPGHAEAEPAADAQAVALSE